jgi:hypothetical protein
MLKSRMQVLHDLEHAEEHEAPIETAAHARLIHSDDLAHNRAVLVCEVLHIAGSSLDLRGEARRAGKIRLPESPVVLH